MNYIETILYANYFQLTFIKSILTIVLISIVLYNLLRRKEKRRLVGYVAGIRIYPVKGAHGIVANEGDVTSFGFKHDRQYALFNEYGTPMRIHRFPNFVLLKVSVEKNAIVVQGEGMPPLKLPLEMKVDDGEHWEDLTILAKNGKGSGVHVSQEADEWFSKYFNVERCKLYCFPVDGKPRYAVDMGIKIKNYKSDEDNIRFSNDSPIMCLASNSIDKINTMIPEDVTADNFRPNIIISHCPAFEEEKLGLIDINGVRLQGLYPSARCPIININPDSGEVTNTILPNLTKVKSICEVEYPKLKGKPVCGKHFGVRKNGIIRIGDPVYEILL